MCYGYDGKAALQESLERRGMSRRGLIAGTLGGLAGAATLRSAAPAAATATPKPWTRVPPGRISIQLYTMRFDLAGPPGYEATLRYLVETGYTKVEQAGYYDHTATQLREFHDSIGIRTTSSHDDISATDGQAHTKFQNAVIMGQKYVVVPYLSSARLADWQAWADRMNAEAALARCYGLRYGYHNHAHEFTTDLGGGLRPWDVLTSRLDPSLVHLEVDLYWAYTGGVNSGAADPDQFAIDVIAEAPQRVRQFHVKDRDGVTGDMCDLGTGVVDFPRIFETSAAEEYIVENDTPDVSPQQTARVGYRYLRTVRF